jgi:hypothetical protein
MAVDAVPVYLPNLGDARVRRSRLSGVGLVDDLGIDKMKKIVSAVAAAALLSAAPAVAQATAAPVPATETGQGSAQFDEMGPAVWILGAVAVGLAIWGIVELVDDDDEEEPVSP